MVRSSDNGLTFPLRGRGTAKRWMRCMHRSKFSANPTRSAFSAFGGHLISRLRRQLEVNCPVGAREATLGCPLKGKLNQSFYILPVIVTTVIIFGRGPPLPYEIAINLIV